MENGPFEDVFRIKNVDIPSSYVSLPEGTNIPICRKFQSQNSQVTPTDDPGHTTSTLAGWNGTKKNPRHKKRVVFSLLEEDVFE